MRASSHMGSHVATVIFLSFDRVPCLCRRTTSALASAASFGVSNPPLVTRSRWPFGPVGSSTSNCHLCRSHLSAPHLLVQRWYTPETSRPRNTYGLFTTLPPLLWTVFWTVSLCRTARTYRSAGSPPPRWAGSSRILRAFASRIQRRTVA